jgi:type I restriction enzyme S subunit
VVGRKGSFGEVHFSSEPCWPIDTTYYINAEATTADLRWLFFRMRALPLTELNRAAAVPGLNREDAYSQELLLPPIEEQRRIAAVLDAADALRAKRRQALATLDTLTQAIFIDMFGGGGGTAVSPNGTPSGHPNGWKWRPILELAELATGHTPDRKRPDYWDGEISWVNLNEIRDFDGRVCHATAARITREGVRHSSAVVLPTGTVCFSRTASIGFVTIMGVPMTTSQDFVNWICGEQLNPTYLMHALLMSREVLRASSSGSTHKTIYVRDAERFTVLHPPRQLQDEFELAILRIRESSRLMSADLSRLDALFASLQQRAFRGEL